MPESEVQSLLFSIEQHSSHPIAKAIVSQYKNSFVKTFNKVVEQKGFGLTATDEQDNIFVVSAASGVVGTLPNTNHDIYLQKNKQLLAAFDLSDTLRPEAASVVAQLNRLNLKTLLISGDKKEKCTTIAQQTNISEVYAPYMPQDKLALINRIKEQEPIAMVGDGINDAPALVAATVGISLGNATQIAIQSAKVILLSGDLHQLPELIVLSRRTMQIVKQNLFWAFFYNVLMVPLAAMGMLNPMLAAAAMSVSSVFVVLNSLRLKQ
jgi:Cu+-exporting ATPase